MSKHIFDPGRDRNRVAPEVKAPVLGLYGEADQGIPLSQVGAMEAALQSAGKTFEIKTYPDAPHGSFRDNVEAMS